MTPSLRIPDLSPILLTAELHHIFPPFTFAFLMKASCILFIKPFKKPYSALEDLSIPMERSLGNIGTIP